MNFPPIWNAADFRSRHFRKTAIAVWFFLVPLMWVLPGIAATLNVPADHATIQAAINAASAGDTIQVAAGTYDEQLTINKKVTLVGAGPSTIVQHTGNLNAGEYDVKIMASGTVIRNFTFDFNGSNDARGFGHTGSGIVVSDLNQPPVNNVTIQNNIIYSADGNTSLQTGENSDISGLLISGNTFYCDSDGLGEGIYVNHFTGNGQVTIKNNWFRGYIYSGISIDAPSVIAKGNDIFSNSSKGIYGIRIFDAAGGKSYGDISILNNKTKGVENGIRIGNKANTASSLTATIRGNSMSNNDIALRVLHGALIMPRFNNFVDNAIAGVSNAVAGTVDATQNWWGSSSGPMHADNTSGAGDVVQGDVIYDPWIQSQVDGVSVTEVQASTTTTTEDEELGLSVDISTNTGGGATVTMASYGNDPTGAGTPFASTISAIYYDLNVENPGNLFQLVFRMYYPVAQDASDGAAHWYDGDQWVLCSNQRDVPGQVSLGDTTFGGYIEVTIRNDTSPSLADLEGTAFAVGLGAAPNQEGGGGDGGCFIRSLLLDR